MNTYISFPELGWRLPVSPEIFSIELFGLDITVRWYGLLIAIGFVLAAIYAFRRADEFELKKDPMIDVVLVCTIMAFIGARLYYVLFSEDRSNYFSNPVTILHVWNGGLAIYGGIIGAFTTALWMCPLRKVNTLRMFDIASPGFLIGQALGRWGNFFNQEAFGGNTTLPWGMTGSWISNPSNGLSGYDHDLPVHPTFLYESLWCLLGLLVLHIVSKKAYKFKGELFSLYIMWYGTGRFFIETLRTDSLYFGTMRVSCLVAALSVLGGLALFLIFRARSKETPADLFADSILPTTDEEPVEEEPIEDDESITDENPEAETEELPHGTEN